MKYLNLTTLLLLSVTTAQAYQVEITNKIEYYDAELNDGNINGSISGTYYFNELNNTKGPLAEAAFLNQASNVSLAYNYGQISSDIKFLNYKIGKIKSEQQSYGIKAETYLPTPWVPVYLNASYHHAINELNTQINSKQSKKNDQGDRYALEVGAMLSPNFLVSLGYTSVADNESLDTFNIINHGLMNALMESRTIDSKKDAITVRTKYVGPIQGTDMSLGFEASLISAEDTMYQLTSDLYLTPKLNVGVTYSNASYRSQTVPNSAISPHINYYITPAINVGLNYVYADGKNGAQDAQLGSIIAKYRF